MGVLFFKAIPRPAIWGHTKEISLGMMIFLKE